jgi:hypothetical protein
VIIYCSYPLSASSFIFSGELSKMLMFVVVPFYRRWGTSRGDDDRVRPLRSAALFRA